MIRINNLLISIIVPVYNAESYLDKCINSLIHQTYKNIEIIMINDGSTDSSLEILEKYQKIDNRIIVFSKENGGGILARKYGVKHSKGQYCLIIDSDDWIEYTTVEKLVYYVNKYKNIDVIKFRTFVEPNKRISDSLINNNKEQLIDNASSEYVFNMLMYTSKFNNIWNSLVKRSVLDFDSFVYDHIVHKAEDLLINLQIYLNAKTYLIVDDVLYHYYTNSSGITNNFNVSKVVSNIEDLFYIKKTKEKIATNLKKQYDEELLNNNYLLFIVEQLYYLLLKGNPSKNDLNIIQDEICRLRVYDEISQVNIGNIKFKNYFCKKIAKKILDKDIKKILKYKMFLKIVAKLIG